MTSAAQCGTDLRLQVHEIVQNSTISRIALSNTTLSEIFNGRQSRSFPSTNLDLGVFLQTAVVDSLTTNMQITSAFLHIEIKQMAKVEFLRASDDCYQEIPFTRVSTNSLPYRDKFFTLEIDGHRNTNGALEEPTFIR